MRRKSNLPDHLKKLASLGVELIVTQEGQEEFREFAPNEVAKLPIRVREIKGRIYFAAVRRFNLKARISREESGRINPEITRTIEARGYTRILEVGGTTYYLCNRTGHFPGGKSYEEFRFGDYEEARKKHAKTPKEEPV